MPGWVSGCGAGSESKKADTQAEAPGTGDSKTADKSYELTVSGIGGSLNYLPIYIAEQEGWFKEKGLDIEEVLFTNGPVQMESLSSDGWDIGAAPAWAACLPGVLGYDALVLGSSNTDDGTQYVFARNDSDIVKAGKGHNSQSDEIYGDADSWKENPSCATRAALPSMC
ncbi:MAG: ABC transporter substrate-binding protein [Enterocloster bolteae]